LRSRKAGAWASPQDRAMRRPDRSNPLARRLAVGALAAWLGTGAAQAPIFKWVDAAGVTHYASQPPPGVSATPVRIPVPVPVPVIAASGRVAEPPPPVARAVPPGSATPAGAEADAGRRLRDCARARQQKAAVTRGGPVFRTDENGQRVYLEDRARDAEIARLGQAAAQLCAGIAEQQQADAERDDAAQAAATGRCLAAQEVLRELTANARTVAQDLERARDDVRQRCGATP